jgi:hypothetical protein
MGLTMFRHMHHYHSDRIGTPADLLRCIVRPTRWNQAQRAGPIIPLVPFDQLNPVPSFFTSRTTKVNVFKESQTGGITDSLSRQPLAFTDRRGFKAPPCDPTVIGCRSEALGASHLPQIVWGFPVRRIATLHSPATRPRLFALALPQIGTDTNVVGSWGLTGP